VISLRDFVIAAAILIAALFVGAILDDASYRPQVHRRG
jgi:hypothetical protein